MPSETVADAKETRFWIGHISPADIVFVYPSSSRLGDRVTRLFNAIGQRILAAVRREERISLRRRIQRYSHVMLGLGNGLVIHADGKTVKIEIITDVIRYGTNIASDFSIYRRDGISPEVADRVVRAAVRYLNKSYSFYTYFKTTNDSLKQCRNLREDTTQFCSRLVSHAYRSAKIPLSSLPDNRLLPVDLFEICQSDEWRDVSAEFIQEAFSGDFADVLGPVELPGEGSMTATEFLEKADELIRQTAELEIERYELEYSTVRRILYCEALLAKYWSACFDVVKHICIDPETLDDAFAFRITRVLKQIDTLLQISLLSTIDVVIKESFINRIDEDTGLSLYAGFPTPTALRELQRMREAVTVYTYLLLAEVGALAILAHWVGGEKFQLFKSVKQEYAQQFIAAVPHIENLEPYKDKEKLFPWVEEPSDRAMCQSLVGNLVATLQTIEILRRSRERG